jgi:alpha-tubulin suppressor-like RCC1 family protein
MKPSRLRLLAPFLVAGCLSDAVRPRSGVPTLDDVGNDGWTAVAAGREHTCALTSDGSAFCWGSNEFSQLGVADDGTTCARGDSNIPCSTVPVPVSGTIRFRRLSAGDAHNCGIATDDRVYCWGDNLRGALGDPSLRRAIAPAPIATTALFSDVAAGGAHSCGLRTDGVALCWGANDMGQIGNGSTISGFGAPSTVSNVLRFASIAAGRARTCGRLAAGTAYCWGSTWVNQASGADVTRAQNTPALVQTNVAFASLAVGRRTTCGVSVANEALCWEANSTGAMGDGTATGSVVPRLVVGGHRFVAVSAGDLQTCGLADTGFAHCWGGDASGELGVSPALLASRCGETRTPCSASPIRVSGWRVFSVITAGQGNHACGLTLAGNIYCWGAGEMGQRGDGRTSRAEWSPVKTRPAQIITANVTDNTASGSSNP